MENVTIKQVAELAGVSIATVSCALSGKKKVKEETKQLVLDAIEKLNYIPSTVAKQLRSEHNKEIGVILTDIDDEVPASILKGILDMAQKNQYSVSVVFSKGNVQNEENLIQNFVSKKVAGLVILQSGAKLNKKTRYALTHHLPNIFLLRKPQDIYTNYATIDSSATLRAIIARLDFLGYKSVSFVCGMQRHTNEALLISIFEDSIKQCKNLKKHSVCQTLMNKEDAFRKTIKAYSEEFPDAIICSSGDIATGVHETLFVYEKKEDIDVTVVAFGCESWCKSTVNNRNISTSANPYLLGYRALEALLSTFISSNTGFYNIHLPDTFNPEILHALPAKKNINVIPSKTVLKIFAPDMHITHATMLLCNNFEKINPQIKIKIEFAEFPKEIFNAMQQERYKEKSLYDLYMFDIPWTANIAVSHYLKDLTSFISSDPNTLGKINFSNTTFNNSIYGVPVGSGSQLLFYRRDLFQDPEIRKEFLKKTGDSLTVPHTYFEFNRIARFFTQNYNPNSPTKYGHALGVALPPDLITYLLPCLWSNNASLFHPQTYVPTINSPAFKRGINQFLQSIPYASPQYISDTARDSTLRFINGECAMSIGFSIFISAINDPHFFSHKLGTSIVPGRKPILAGWAMGMSNYTPYEKEAFTFLNWLLSPHINSYHTVITGQEMHHNSLQSSELTRLYPWLHHTRQIEHYSKKRMPPVTLDNKSVPIIKMEEIITNIIYQVMFNYLSLDEALNLGQKNMVALFNACGIGTPVM